MAKKQQSAAPVAASKQGKVIINVMAAAGLIVAAYGSFADARDLANESNKGAWSTAARQMTDAGRKQGETLRTTTIAQALKTWGDSSAGKVKTLTTAVNIAARAVKLGIAMFEGDKVLSREKVRTLVKVAERIEAGAGAGEASTFVQPDTADKGTVAVNLLSADSIKAVLHYLSVAEQAAPFGPDILKAAEAAGMRVMTPEEQTALTAHYAQSLDFTKKAA